MEFRYQASPIRGCLLSFPFLLPLKIIRREVSGVKDVETRRRRRRRCLNFTSLPPRSRSCWGGARRPQSKERRSLLRTDAIQAPYLASEATFPGASYVGPNSEVGRVSSFSEDEDRVESAQTPKKDLLLHCLPYSNAFPEEDWVYVRSEKEVVRFSH